MCWHSALFILWQINKTILNQHKSQIQHLKGLDQGGGVRGILFRILVWVCCLDIQTLTLISDQNVQLFKGHFQTSRPLKSIPMFKLHTTIKSTPICRPKWLKNHTPWSGTYLYRTTPPFPPPQPQLGSKSGSVTALTEIGSKNKNTQDIILDLLLNNEGLTVFEGKL